MYVFVICFSYTITLTDAHLYNSVNVLCVYNFLYSTGVIRGDLCSRKVANPFRDGYPHFNYPILYKYDCQPSFLISRPFQLLRVFISYIWWKNVLMHF